MIIFTSDSDWAPEPVVEDMMELFEAKNIKCTIFGTNDSAALKDANKEIFGLHPNFNDLALNNINQIKRSFEDLQNIFPGARGVRAHSLLNSTPLLNFYRKSGMKYEASLYLPYAKDLCPYRLWNGLFRIPFNWEDDIHAMYGYSFKDLKLELKKNQLNILNFHPIHVYLNTFSLEHYESAKKDYQNIKLLSNHRNNNYYGVRDLLIRLLEKTSINSESIFVSELLDL